jgi:hypothetical protein
MSDKVSSEKSSTSMARTSKSTPKLPAFVDLRGFHMDVEVGLERELVHGSILIRKERVGKIGNIDMLMGCGG